MIIRAGYQIAYDHIQATPMLLIVSVHPSRVADLLSPGDIVLDPPTVATQHFDHFGNSRLRIIAPPGRLTISTDFTIQDSGQPDIIAPDAVQHPVAELPDDVLTFLFGSRYCETDRLAETAWSLFGHTEPGWARVQAICDYVHDRITFGYEHASPTRTAAESFAEQRGVCRDYAHLAVTFCRCMNIPARYCTGYLGDIGVPPVDFPMDFSAWFDVYLSGQWFTFDARHNFPRIGRILMARGRDATDVAISTSFGTSVLADFNVTCEQVG